LQILLDGILSKVKRNKNIKRNINQRKSIVITLYMCWEAYYSASHLWDLYNLWF